MVKVPENNFTHAPSLETFKLQLHGNKLENVRLAHSFCYSLHMFMSWMLVVDALFKQAYEWGFQYIPVQFEQNRSRGSHLWDDQMFTVLKKIPILFLYVHKQTSRIDANLTFSWLPEFLNKNFVRTSEKINASPLQISCLIKLHQPMWDLRWTKWYWDNFFSWVLRFSPVNIIPPWLYILVFQMGDGQYAVWWPQSRGMISPHRH
jgi:hypothetical protein